MEKKSFLFDEFETFLKSKQDDILSQTLVGSYDDHVHANGYIEDGERYQNQNKQRSFQRTPILSTTYTRYPREKIHSPLLTTTYNTGNVPSATYEGKNILTNMERQLEQDGVVTPKMERAPSSMSYESNPSTQVEHSSDQERNSLYDNDKEKNLENNDQEHEIHEPRQSPNLEEKHYDQTNTNSNGKDVPNHGRKTSSIKQLSPFQDIPEIQINMNANTHHSTIQRRQTLPSNFPPNSKDGTRHLSNLPYHPQVPSPSIVERFPSNSPLITESKNTSKYKSSEVTESPSMEEKFIKLEGNPLHNGITIPSPSVVSQPITPSAMSKFSNHSEEDDIFSPEEFDKELNDIRRRWINKEAGLQEKEFQLKNLEKTLERENERIRTEKERVASLVRRLEESERKRLSMLNELKEKERKVSEKEAKLQKQQDEQSSIEQLLEIKIAKAEQYLREEKSSLRIEKERLQLERERISSERETLQSDQRHLDNTFADLRKAEAECKQSFQSLKEEQAIITRKMNEIQNREDMVHKRELACREAEAKYKESLNHSFEISEFKRNLKRLVQERKQIELRERELASKEQRIMQQNASLQNEIRRMEILQRDIIREKEYIREQKRDSLRRGSHHYFSPQLNIDEDLNRSERIRSWIRSLEKSVDQS